MPQLSLYLDDDTLDKIEKGAKINNISASKLVSRILKDYFANKFPEGYENLFGSILDESFNSPIELNFKDDIARENF